ASRPSGGPPSPHYSYPMSIPRTWPQVLDFFGLPLVIEPSQGRLSSDAGLLPIRQFDDVGVADLLAARAFGPGLPQPTPSRQTSGPGLAPVTYRANSRSVNRHPSAFRLADAEEKG